MSKTQPSLAVVLIALVIAFPADAAKKRAKKKAKPKAEVSEAMPSDLPPVDEESLPGNEKASGESVTAGETASAVGPAPVEPPAELPEFETASPEVTASKDDVTPAEIAAAQAAAQPTEPPIVDPDDREPAQMGPSQGATMNADTPPPAEELTPPEPPAPPVAEEVPEAPSLRAVTPPPAVAELPPDSERLPPTDYEAVRKKRAAERRTRETALEQMADDKAADEYPVLKPGRFKPRRLAEEDNGGSISAESNRDYTYQSPRHFGLDIQYAPVQYKALTLGGDGAYANKLGAGARVNFEWMFLQDIGKLSLGLGLHYDNLPSASSVSGEALTVTALGGEVGLTYRLDLVEHQIVVPLVRFGVDGAYATQNRSDQSVFSQGSYRGTLFGVGAELCLFIFEKRTARLLDRKFGINDTYFVFEYVKSSNAKSGVQPDLSHDEFRFGLRFEI